MKEELKKAQIEDCSPLTHPVLSRQQAVNMATLFAALADPTRVAILNLLAEGEQEVCVCDIAESFEVGQSTVSRHLKVLKDVGLISSQKRGKWVYYSIIKGRTEEIKAILDRLMHLSTPPGTLFSS